MLKEKAMVKCHSITHPVKPMRDILKTDNEQDIVLCWAHWKSTGYLSLEWRRRFKRLLHNIKRPAFAEYTFHAPTACSWYVDGYRFFVIYFAKEL